MGLWTYRAAAVLLVLAIAGCEPTPDHPVPPAGIASPASPVTPTVGHPDPGITPGVVLTRNAADVCTPGWAGDHRESLTVREERQVLAEYGLPTMWATESGHVSEWDHLISLQLGGGNGIRNVWPQLDHDQDQRKDRLETKLHTLVCHGELGLTEAQNRITTFWRYW